jgi:4-hydroxy-tetrahydrodipicolinate synthase
MTKEIQIEQLKGVFSPVITPFNPDLSVDYKKLIHQCEWLISQEVGLAVFGTNSEANSLSVDEKIFLLDKLVEYGIDPNKLMPGTGCCALSDTIKLTKHAVKLGCSGVLMLPPFYYKAVSDDGLLEYFSNVIDSVNDDRLRIYLYHIPPIAMVGISLHLIEKLLKRYPRYVAGIKDSSGDWSNTQNMLDEKWDNFSIFAGSESFLLKTMQNGGAGCISATANINPKKIFDVYKYWKKSDSIDMQEELNVLRNIVQSYPLIPALKCIVSHFCKDKTWNILRPPLTGLNLSDSKKLIKELNAINFNLIKSN